MPLPEIFDTRGLPSAFAAEEAARSCYTAVAQRITPRGRIDAQIDVQLLQETMVLFYAPDDLVLCDSCVRSARAAGPRSRHSMRRRTWHAERHHRRRRRRSRLHDFDLR